MHLASLCGLADPFLLYLLGRREEMFSCELVKMITDGEVLPGHGNIFVFFDIYT